ncbi:putative domain XH, zinc finger-XS domain protein [Tanacetum coccineum]
MFVRNLPDAAVSITPNDALLEVYMGIVDVVSKLHKDRIRHGSLHPRNIFVTYEGTVKVSVLQTVSLLIKKAKDPNLKNVSDELIDKLYTLGELFIYIGLKGQYEYRKATVIGICKDPKLDLPKIDQWSYETRDIANKLLNRIVKIDRRYDRYKHTPFYGMVINKSISFPRYGAAANLDVPRPNAPSANGSLHSLSPRDSGSGVSDDAQKEKIKFFCNTGDEKIRSLKNGFDEDVYNAVVTALNELNVYNPSCRYTIPEFWNQKENRKALLK